jgi:hypothetical protein
VTDLQRALADRDTALRGLREAQAVIVTLEAQLARSLRQTVQALAVAQQAIQERT